MEKVISKYLRSETQHSLMINGKWGSGKTYFIKNKLKSLIEKEGFKLIYSSANGVGSFEDIMSQVLSEKNPLSKLNNKYTRVAFQLAKLSAKLGAKVAGFEKFLTPFGKLSFKKQDFFNLEKDVIIIDDVERINFNKLSIPDLLGTVSNIFTEHSNVKVILVCDEDELNKVSEVNAEDYNRIKEKTIWRTLRYELNHQEVVQKLIHTTIDDSAVKEFLEENADYIVSLLVLTKTENLRHLKFYFQIIEEVISSIGLSTFKKLSKSLLQSIFIISKEYKDGKIDSSKHLEPEEYFLSSRTISAVLFSGLTGEQEPDERRTLTSVYSELFETVGNEYIFLLPIYTLITTGEINNESLRVEASALLGNNNNETIWNQSMSYIKNFRNADSNTFKDEYDNVIGFIEDGKYDVYTLMTFINFSIFFIENNLLSKFGSIEELLVFMKPQINKSRNTTNYEMLIANQLKKEYKNKYSGINEIIDLVEEIHNEKWKEANVDNSKQTLLKITIPNARLEQSEFRNMLIFLPKEEFHVLVQKYISDPTFPETFYRLVKNEWFTFYDQDNGEDNLSYLLECIKKEKDQSDKLLDYKIRNLEELLESKKD